MDRNCLLAVVVAAMLLFTGFPGTAAAAQAPTQQAQDAQQGQETIQVSHLEVRDLSTSMTLESATILIERDATTRRIAVDSAELELTNATVQVQDATLEGDTLSVASANVTITDGMATIETNEGDRTIDLSDTNASVQDESVTLTDIEGEMPGLEQMLREGTISSMTVEGVSGTAEVADAGALVRSGEDGQSATIALVDGTMDVESASMELTEATIEEGGPGEEDTLVIEEVTVSVDSAELTAERYSLVQNSEAREGTNAQVTVEDFEMTRENVEITRSSLDEMLSELLQRGMAGSTSGG